MTCAPAVRNTRTIVSGGPVVSRLSDLRGEERGGKLVQWLAERGCCDHSGETRTAARSPSQPCPRSNAIARIGGASALRHRPRQRAAGRHRASARFPRNRRAENKSTFRPRCGTAGPARPRRPRPLRAVAQRRGRLARRGAPTRLAATGSSISERAAPPGRSRHAHLVYQLGHVLQHLRGPLDHACSEEGAAAGHEHVHPLLHRPSALVHLPVRREEQGAHIVVQTEALGQRGKGEGETAGVRAGGVMPVSVWQERRVARESPTPARPLAPAACPNRDCCHPCAATAGCGARARGGRLRRLRRWQRVAAAVRAFARLQ